MLPPVVVPPFEGEDSVVIVTGLCVPVPVKETVFEPVKEAVLFTVAVPEKGPVFVGQN